MIRRVAKPSEGNNNGVFLFKSSCRMFPICLIRQIFSKTDEIELRLIIISLDEFSMFYRPHLAESF